MSSIHLKIKRFIALLVYVSALQGCESIAQTGSGDRGISASMLDAGMSVIPVQGNVYMIFGGGGNTAVQLGEDGLLVVDTKAPGAEQQLLAAIKNLSGLPVRAIVNTHGDYEHVGGNGAITATYNPEDRESADSAALASGVSAARFRMTIYAHENVMLGMVEPEPRGMPSELWPNLTYFTPEKELYLNGEAVILRHQPNAHTDGDTFVHFRGSDVIVAGGIYANSGFPVFDASRGGSIEGVISGLNELLRLIVSQKTAEGGTIVIPGHGRLADEADVIEYRDMVVLIRDRILRMKKDGMSLAEVQDARPAIGYEPRYGDGAWSTEEFVEAVYMDIDVN